MGDEFDFPIVKFPYLGSNIPESPACGVFVSQLIRYARVCSKYEDFLFRGSILISKLLKQGYSSRKLQTNFRKFYGRHTHLVHKFDTSVSHMLKGLFTNCDIWLVSLFGGKSWRVPHVGRKCSLFPEHLISLTLGSFHPFIIHVLLNLSI